ncbi:MAG: serine/threonine protein kinase, partial [Myxococcales bacterium]|nr:serine/threonine protein kinase [Myxococcales bacterium]
MKTQATARDELLSEVVDFVQTQLTLVQKLGDPTPRVTWRYEIERPVARGAKGFVCRARDLHLGRTVALKLYPYSPMIQRLGGEVDREAKALAQLEHNNIIKVYDYGHAHLTPEGPGVLYVVMEFIDGVSLREWNERPHPVETILDVYIAAGNGLHYAHTQGLVHRDFKPDNVVIGRSGVPKIVDFGLASAFEPIVHEIEAEAEAGEPSVRGDEVHTRTGVIRGTMAYLAPECFRGIADAKSDQYAYAASVWEALFGELPYAPDDVESRARGELLPPQQPSPVPAELIISLKRALSPNPAARFTDVDALVHELLNVRDPRNSSSVNAIARPLRSTESPRRAWLRYASFAFALGAGLWFSQEYKPIAASTEMLTARLFGDVEPITDIVPDPVDEEALCPGGALLRGEWRFNATVVWAPDLQTLGQHTIFALTFEPGPDCRVDMVAQQIRDRHGPFIDPPRDRLSLQRKRLTPFQDHLVADLWLAQRTDDQLTRPISPEQRRGGAEHYQMEFFIRDESLIGHWTHITVNGEIDAKGVLRGGPGAAPASVPRGFSDIPCQSQCAMRCAGSNALEQCRARHCLKDATASVDDCGSPDRDFRPPRSTSPRRAP